MIDSPTAATLASTALVDSDHPAVVELARRHARGDSDRERAVALHDAVRDGFRYDPYQVDLSPGGMRASSVIERGHGWCVTKAALLAAACRAAGIPARLGYADVRNHLSTERMRRTMQTDLFIWHGYTDIWLDGAWRKATPTFNATLCEKVGVKPLDFDGHSDALLHPFDGEGRAYMQYVNDHGTYHDVPAKFLMREMARDYANMQGEDLSGRDMEQEAAER